MPRNKTDYMREYQRAYRARNKAKEVSPDKSLSKVKVPAGVAEMAPEMKAKNPVMDQKARDAILAKIRKTK